MLYIVTEITVGIGKEAFGIRECSSKVPSASRNASRMGMNYASRPVALFNWGTVWNYTVLCELRCTGLRPVRQIHVVLCSYAPLEWFGLKVHSSVAIVSVEQDSPEKCWTGPEYGCTAQLQIGLHNKIFQMHRSCTALWACPAITTLCAKTPTTA